jgi:hypothetical protein
LLLQGSIFMQSFFQWRMSSADLYNKGLTSCKRERSGPIKIIRKKPV